MEVHLSEDLEKLVQEKVESGRYRSAGEVVRRALLVLDNLDQLEMRSESSMSPARAAEAWEDFFRLGDTLASSDSQESGTLTAAVLAMRR